MSPAPTASAIEIPANLMKSSSWEHLIRASIHRRQDEVQAWFDAENVAVGLAQSLALATSSVREPNFVRSDQDFADRRGTFAISLTCAVFSQRATQAYLLNRS